MYIDKQVSERCWNTYDSYGEICVHCGCCSKDKATRHKARAEAIRGWLWQHENWYKPYDTWEEYRLKNRRDTIRHWKRMLRYYERAMKEAT